MKKIRYLGYCGVLLSVSCLASHTIETSTIQIINLIPNSETNETVDPDGTFTLVLKNLKAGTYVTFPDEVAITTDDSSKKYATRKSRSTEYVNPDGTASAEYTIPHDVYTGNITSITVQYQKSNGGSYFTETVTFNASIRDYTPASSYDFTNFSAGDIIPITISGGLNGQEITWTLADDSKGEFYSDAQGTTKLENNTSVFNSSNTSVIYFKGVTASNNDAIKINVHTMNDDLVINGKYNVWSPTFTVPSTLDYESSSNNVITFADQSLKPNSQVTLSITAASQITGATSSVGASDITLNSGKQSGSSITLTADENGNITDPITIAGVSNFAVSDFTVNANVYTSTEKKTDLATQKVTMKTYKLAATSDKLDSSKHYLEKFANNDINVLGKTNVTISGGFANKPVTLTLVDSKGEASFATTSGKDNTNTSAQTKTITTNFGPDGSVTVPVYAYGKFTGTPEISISGIERSTSIALNYKEQGLSPVINLPQLAADSYPRKLYSSHLHTTNGTDTVDFKDGSQTFNVTGLLKNSKITATVGGSSDGVTCDNADTSGTAKCTIPADTNTSSNTAYYSTRAVKVNYIDPDITSGSTVYVDYQTPKNTKSKYLYTYQYALTAKQTDSSGNTISEIYGDDTYTVTVSGGRPGDIINFSLTGDGTFVGDSNRSFESDGSCQIQVQGANPYSTKITVTGTTVNY